MALTEAKKTHKCKRGHTINKGDQYYPQRRNKALCFNCGYKPKRKTFIYKLLEWLK